MQANQADCLQADGQTAALSGWEQLPLPFNVFGYGNQTYPPQHVGIVEPLSPGFVSLCGRMRFAS